MSKESIFTEIREKALKAGADLCGFGFVSEYRKKAPLPEYLEKYNAFATVAVRLASGILEEIIIHPTFSYLAHYRQVNFLLDRITLEISSFLEKGGIEAYPVPASQITDWKKRTGLVSHRFFAELSGIAFRGINNLSVTENFGARVRLATVLMKLPENLFSGLNVKMGTVPLEWGQPPENYCSSCGKCIAVCPAGAIKKDLSDFDGAACYNTLNRFVKEGKASQHICGICVRACDGNRSANCFSGPSACK